MKITRGASARTRLTKRQLLEEGKEYRQILPAAEVIVKNDFGKWNLGNNKAHKKPAAGVAPEKGDRASAAAQVSVLVLWLPVSESESESVAAGIYVGVGGHEIAWRSQGRLGQ